MKIKVTGTYRERLRVKILWFWIVGPWKERQILEEWPVPKMGHTFGAGPLTVTAMLDTGGLNVILSLAGYQLWQQQFVAVGAKRHIHAEPIKGLILDAVIEVIA